MSAQEQFRGRSVHLVPLGMHEVGELQASGDGWRQGDLFARVRIQSLYLPILVWTVAIILSSSRGVDADQATIFRNLEITALPIKDRAQSDSEIYSSRMTLPPLCRA